MPTQGTSIHQAKPWSTHDVEVNDERLEYHALHALHLFDKMPRPNVYSWNAILVCYCKAEGLMDARELFLNMPERNIEKGLGVYDAMISEGMVPTHFTLAILFSACRGWLDVEKGRKCHSLVEQIGLEVNVYVGNTLLCMYAKCGVIKDAMQVFGEMAKPNEITFTAMTGELKKIDKVVEALEMFKLIWRKGVRIDSVLLFVDIKRDPLFVALSLLKTIVKRSGEI
ncbi:putative pentatricopeptide [Rosa chinensis]|uniref:Putative pentatricopeptide n=1 Tax=Rosa chinensis TaxID=74649 RepID=A0A2P6SJL9_ROSCH|nr:putative pentatricopeptide [Rosa chinensis]